MVQRLQKILSEYGLASRREAERIMEAGRVTVNGFVARVGESADPEQDVILLDGKPLQKKPEKRYLMLNKPRGYVTSMHDEKGRKDVSLLVADCGVRLYPVGRLDMDSEGLLLFTNDGELANRLMHPAAEANKTYLVTVTGYYEGAEERLAQSMVIDGYRIRPAKVKNIMHHGEEAQLQITIHEGRNRQIRKMCETVGIRVKKLQRVEENGVKLGNLPLGQWRWLTEEEIKILQEFHK
ncbi:MAG: rRNA pseudouridine synthase [Ruminococcaceae bacterium]|nr:rRNA pseudouridine synthase [Oscillospiraceae bacterium]